MNHKRQKVDFTPTGLNQDHLSRVSEFLLIQDLFELRRVSCSFRHRVDKLKSTISKRVKNILIRQHDIPQSLLNLIDELGGLISGSTLVQIIRNEVFQCVPYFEATPVREQESKNSPDIDIFIPFSAHSQIKSWIEDSKESIWHYDEFRRKERTCDSEGEIKDCEGIALFNVGTYVRKDDDVRQGHHKPLQFIYLKKHTPKEWILNYFDITLLQNWFDGKKLYVGHMNDFLNNSFKFCLQPWHLEEVCCDLVLNRIKKYQRRYFHCINFEEKFMERRLKLDGKQLIDLRFSYVDQTLVYAASRTSAIRYQGFQGLECGKWKPIVIALDNVEDYSELWKVLKENGIRHLDMFYRHHYHFNYYSLSGRKNGEVLSDNRIV
jgi:hypothetical protein